MLNANEGGVNIVYELVALVGISVSIKCEWNLKTLKLHVKEQ